MVRVMSRQSINLALQLEKVLGSSYHQSDRDSPHQAYIQSVLTVTKFVSHI